MCIFRDLNIHAPPYLPWKTPPTEATCPNVLFASTTSFLQSLVQVWILSPMHHYHMVPEQHEGTPRSLCTDTTTRLFQHPHLNHMRYLSRRRWISFPPRLSRNLEIRFAGKKYCLTPTLSGQPLAPHEVTVAAAHPPTPRYQLMS